jgi:predicted DNA-binding protein YlxM (UPF0122 family)
MAMTLRLTEAQDAKLTEYAEKAGISKQRAVEVLIETADYQADREAKLKRIYDKVMERDAVLMERLADA